MAETLGNEVLKKIRELAPNSRALLRKQLLKYALDELNYSLPNKYLSSWETHGEFHGHATAMIPKLHVKKKFEETWSEEKWIELFPDWVNKPDFSKNAIMVFKRALGVCKQKRR